MLLSYYWHCYHYHHFHHCHLRGTGSPFGSGQSSPPKKANAHKAHSRTQEICRAGAWTPRNCSATLLSSAKLLKPYGRSPYQDSGFQRFWRKHNFNVKGWNSHVHRVFPGNREPTNLRDNVSRKIRLGVVDTSLELFTLPLNPRSPQPWSPERGNAPR